MAKIVEVSALPPETTTHERPELPLAEEDGIYFHLDADAQYHPASGLGSGDIKRLYYNPSAYWWNSPLNPMRPPRTETNFMTFGKAVHVRVLEGEEKFNRLYECAYEGDDLLRTDDDIKAWLTARGVTPMKGLKADRVAQALTLDPEVKIADVIKARAEAEGRVILPADEYRRIVISSKLIADNPDLATAFSGGMPEVAIVWTEIVDGEPVKCKALLDYLKIRGIGDLKSTSNPKEIAFPNLCRIRFAERRMDIQAAHYLRAREFIPRFVEEGRVFGDHDPEWLRKVAAQEEYGFAFVFFSTTGAPETWPLSLSPGNPILDIAADHRATALQNYVRCRREYGDDMWLSREPIRELDIADLPGWHGRM